MFGRNRASKVALSPDMVARLAAHEIGRRIDETTSPFHATSQISFEDQDRVKSVDAFLDENVRPVAFDMFGQAMNGAGEPLDHLEVDGASSIQEWDGLTVRFVVSHFAGEVQTRLDVRFSR